MAMFTFKTGGSSGLTPRVSLPLAAIACLVLAPAAAQDSAEEDVSPNVSVTDRFNQNFAADGIRRGSIIFLPVLGYTQIYDDNIFGVPTGETDDFIAQIEGALSIASDWERHGFGLQGSVRRLQFFENTDESTTDYSTRATGIIDFSRRARATITGGFERSTEARRSLQTAFGDQPVQFSVYRAAGEIEFRQNRFVERLGVAYRRDDFDDVVAGGGGIIDQDFRDRDVLTAFFRQSWRARPTVSLFVQVAGGVQSYDSVQIGLGANQDSQSYGASAGVEFDINKVARGEIGVGYQTRNYDSDLFEDISGLNIDAEFEYFVTDLTTITLSAERAIQNTAIEGAAGFYTNNGDITIEHELFRPVVLVGRAEYRVDDFRGGFDRRDEFFRISGGIDYAFRRNIIFNVRYIYIDVSSRGADARPGFDENIIQVGLEFRR